MGRQAKELGPLAGDKCRDMGLVGFPDVSLAGAREAAREARAKVRDGVDPVADSRALRSAMKADQAQAKTFKFCALAYIDAHEAGWRNAKNARQWRNTLDTYAYPCPHEETARQAPQTLSPGATSCADLRSAAAST